MIRKIVNRILNFKQLFFLFCLLKEITQLDVRNFEFINLISFLNITISTNLLIKSKSK